MTIIRSRRIDRRTFLSSGALALAGTGLLACAPKRIVSAAPAPLPPATASSNLPVPRISWDRVIRTTVGLRPFRESGFVLRPEKFDEKLVIHDYGFGGTGMSLAWGCGAMVSDVALEQSERHIAVLGCGSPGLTAARQLQRRGFNVTIYTMAVPPYTTSNMSWAGFTPTSGLVTRRTPEWDAQFRKAAEISYRELQLLVDHPGSGVYWIDSYAATDIDPRSRPGGKGEEEFAEGGDLLPEPLWPERDQQVLEPGEHPFPTKYAILSPSIGIEPNLYLDQLVRDLMSLPESVIVNCTGLGSKTLFNDNELTPIKGQLTVCVPQPELNYRLAGRLPGDEAFTSINPRPDGIIVGNMRERGNWSLEPNALVRQQNIEAAIHFTRAMRPHSGHLQVTRSRRPRTIPKVEDFFGAES